MKISINFLKKKKRRKKEEKKEKEKVCSSTKPSGLLAGGGGRRKGPCKGKILWNHLWKHRSSVPDPRAFPPPGGRFSAPTTENRIYNWAAQAAQ